MLVPRGLIIDAKKSALAILRDVDDALDGWTCDASTECCRFAVTGREPWVTQVEWQLVVDETARQGRKLPAIPEDADERCPFLGGNNRCTVYASRPLGCRTFFCERARHEHRALSGKSSAPSTSTREMREAARSLDALKTVSASDDGKPRPLRSWLRAATKGSARHGRR